MVEVGKRLNRNICAVISSMNQPLGRAVGNSVEIQEVIEFIKGNMEPDLKEITYTLCTKAFEKTGKFKTKEESYKYLDELIIDNYNQKLELNPSSKEIAAYCEEHPGLNKKVTIVMRKPKEILTSRGGDAPNRLRQEIFPEISCVLPFKQIIVRPDGKVSLCCNDPMGKYTLGDLTIQSLTDIWYGESFQDVRTRLMNGRKAFGDCRFCDTLLI